MPEVVLDTATRTFTHAQAVTCLLVMGFVFTGVGIVLKSYFDYLTKRHLGEDAQKQEQQRLHAEQQQKDREHIMQQAQRIEGEYKNILVKQDSRVSELESREKALIDEKIKLMVQIAYKDAKILILQDRLGTDVPDEDLPSQHELEKKIEHQVKNGHGKNDSLENDLT